MQRIFLLFISVLSFSVSDCISQQLASPILLWPQGAPGATGHTDEDKPAVIPFVPTLAKRNGAAVLVVPGGGFTIRAVDHEGVLVAQWFKDHGVTAFLLRYRLRPLYTRNDWVRDGQRGMQYIRAHANEYGLSVDRVGAIGFSAGANLIADMSLQPALPQTNATDPLNRFNSKPDFLVLGYGSIRIPNAIDSSALKHFPRTFMYGTVEDRSSHTGMIEMYHRLYEAGISLEAHFFQNGIHGTGFALGDPVLGEWTKLLHNWLAVGGFFSRLPQLELNGQALLDGAPLVKGMIILTPMDNRENPPVTIYINNTGTGKLGEFTVPKSQGPCAGRYKVEVRQDAKRWVSNSRDPFMIKMMDKQARASLTDADKKEWGDYLRKRDLSPSITSQLVFNRKHPNDKSDYIVNIKENAELIVEVFSK